MLAYLQAFADYYGLHDLVHLNTGVVKVAPLLTDAGGGRSPQSCHHRWEVQTRRMETKGGKALAVDEGIHKVSVLGNNAALNCCLLVCAHKRVSSSHVHLWSHSCQ